MAGMDEKFMALALKQASRSLYKTWPNPAVGAVVVKGGRVLAAGATRAVRRRSPTKISLQMATIRCHAPGHYDIWR